MRNRRRLLRESVGMTAEEIFEKEFGLEPLEEGDSELIPMKLPGAPYVHADLIVDEEDVYYFGFQFDYDLYRDGGPIYEDFIKALRQHNVKTITNKKSEGDEEEPPSYFFKGTTSIIDRYVTKNYRRWEDQADL